MDTSSGNTFLKPKKNFSHAELFTKNIENELSESQNLIQYSPEWYNENYFSSDSEQELPVPTSYTDSSNSAYADPTIYHPADNDDYNINFPTDTSDNQLT